MFLKSNLFKNTLTWHYRAMLIRSAMVMQMLFNKNLTGASSWCIWHLASCPSSLLMLTSRCCNSTRQFSSTTYHGNYQISLQLNYKTDDISLTLSTCTRDNYSGLRQLFCVCVCVCVCVTMVAATYVYLIYIYNENKATFSFLRHFYILLRISLKTLCSEVLATFTDHLCLLRFLTDSQWTKQIEMASLCIVNLAIGPIIYSLTYQQRLLLG